MIVLMIVKGRPKPPAPKPTPPTPKEPERGPEAAAPKDPSPKDVWGDEGEKDAKGSSEKISSGQA
jgi:hypothetical protein